MARVLLSAEHCCALWGEAPCGSAVYGWWMEMSPAPLPPSPLPLCLPQPPPLLDPLPILDPAWTDGRQGGQGRIDEQGRIDDITGEGLRTAVALSTASCSLCDKVSRHRDTVERQDMGQQPKTQHSTSYGGRPHYLPWTDLVK